MSFGSTFRAMMPALPLSRPSVGGLTRDAGCRGLRGRPAAPFTGLFFPARSFTGGAEGAPGMAKTATVREAMIARKNARFRDMRHMALISAVPQRLKYHSWFHYTGFSACGQSF